MESYQPTWSEKSISEENLWWLLFSKFIQKRPKCHNPTYMQGQVLWIWAFGCGGLSSKVAWAGLHPISGHENFIFYKFYISASSSLQNAPVIADMVTKKPQQTKLHWSIS